MTTELSGEDASVMAATQKILSLGPSAWGDDAAAPPKRENQTHRDPIERETSTDLEESEQDAQQAGATDEKADKAPDAADAADYIEIPGEGDEAEKVPLAQAVEAIKQMRALNGDIATAVNKAEAEYQARVDDGLAQMARVYDAVVQQAQMAIQSIPTPEPPPRNLITEDPEVYQYLLQQYEQQMTLFERAQTTARAAMGERQRIEAQQDALRIQRENERLGRYIPEWKDEAKREELGQRMTEFMVKQYGLDEQTLNRVSFDHRLVRAMHELMTLKGMQTAAPEVRKTVQEKAPKIVKSAPSQTRGPDGKFTGQSSTAAKELKETGSEDAAARLFLTDPRFKSLFAG